jgi:xanthine dehydrogenase molybdenum-binding subunit
MYYDTTGGITQDGHPTFLDSVVTVSNGGVGDALLNAVYPAGEAAVSVYKYDSIYCEAWPVWTNLNISGSRRSYGDAEGMFCSEQFIDEMLEKIDADPVEWRSKWAEEPGGLCTLRYTWTEFAGGNYPLLIQKASDTFDWKNKWKGWKVPTAVNGSKKRGIGVALSMHITGQTMHRGLVKINPDGTVEVLSSLMEVGQGIKAACCQSVAETLGVSYDQVRPALSMSQYAPKGGGVAASQGTPNAIGAAVLAAKDAKRQLFEIASANLGVSIDDLDIGDGKVFVKDDPTKFQTLAAIANKRWGVIGQGWEPWPWISKTTGLMLAEKSLAVCMAEVEVDTDTGIVTVIKMVNAADCGQIINPNAVEGQLYQGVIYGLGYGMYGELIYDKTHEGVIVNADPLNYRVPTILEAPEITNIIHSDPADAPTCQYGCKGCGEGTNVPIAPAIGNAIYNACGIRLRDHPFTPDKVLAALGKV